MWVTETSELNKLDRSIEELWVRGPKFKDLEFIYRFPELKRLYLGSIKTDDLAPLASPKKLTLLALTNVGNGASLQPLSQLECLEELILQTPPGWDGSNKVLRYVSLTPLAQLEKLRKLTILDVVFDTDELEPLIQVASLSHLITRNKFTREQFARLSKYKPNLECRYTQPYTTWEGFEYYRCSNCGEMKVEFSGVDLKRRVFCRCCNKSKCEELVARFDKIKREV